MVTAGMTVERVQVVDDDDLGRDLCGDATRHESLQTLVDDRGPGAVGDVDERNNGCRVRPRRRPAGLATWSAEMTRRQLAVRSARIRAASIRPVSARSCAVALASAGNCMSLDRVGAVAKLVGLDFERGDLTLERGAVRGLGRRVLRNLVAQSVELNSCRLRILAAASDEGGEQRVGQPVACVLRNDQPIGDG